MVDVEHVMRIARAKNEICKKFDAGDWWLLKSLLGPSGAIISNHSRLLRSLNFGNEDYPACVADVLGDLVEAKPDALELVESILKSKNQAGSSNEQSNSFRRIGSSIDGEVDATLATAMMPFNDSFIRVREAMANACSNVGLQLRAADNVWNESVLIEDILELIRRAHVVIVDFTGKNPNVMYETGIAHAWGKEVIPTTQSLDDVPFDLRHHRILLYRNDSTGLEVLRLDLENRMRTIIGNHEWSSMMA